MAYGNVVAALIYPEHQNFLYRNTEQHKAVLLNVHAFTGVAVLISSKFSFAFYNLLFGASGLLSACLDFQHVFLTKPSDF